jgi:DNA polymerase I
MTTLKLRLNLPNNQTEQAERVQAAVKRKQAATETMEEAWARILAMKNSDADRQRLLEVKRAMEAGKIGRSPADASKRFSKAEALRLWRQLAELERERKIAELVAKTPGNYILVDTIEKLQRMAADISSSDLIAVDCETFGEDGGALDPWRGKMAGFSVSTRNYNYYVPINHQERTQLSINAISDYLWDVLESAKIVMHNAPFDCKWFYVQYGLNLIDNLYADTRIMAMALDENRSHRLKDLVTDWLREPSDNFEELFGNTPFNEIPLDVALPYAAGDTEKTLKLYDWMMRYLNTDRLAQIKRLIFEIEMPVCRQFIWSDLRGIKFDVEAAKELDAKLAEEESKLKVEIYKLLGGEINLNSPSQLKVKLFDELKLTNPAKGSTSSKVLKKIQNEHPVIPLLLEYREVGKLRQAFTQKLPNEIKADGKIHPWHNTWGAATGRFTCENPNTQQIPAKRPEIRKLFTATSDDRILVSIDYSQIELRVLAHMANEPALIKAFHEGRDIHSTTAAMISNGKYTYEDIERDKDTEGHPCQKLRKQAKVVNFGIVYGMSAKGLAATLNISEEEAQKIIDSYFEGYKGIKRYMDEQKRLARTRGFVTDIFGRKRRLHAEYKSKDKFEHYRADRQAGNYPIQASAGSILKKAIVDLQPILPEMDVYILSQTHDEILYDCPRNISRENLYKIRDVMANAVKLRVPVTCDIEIYPKRWMEKVKEEDWFGGI